MSELRMALDLFSAVAAAADGIARTLRRDQVSAVLFWGEPPVIEVVHRRGVPEDVCRALATVGGRHIAGAVRRSGQPLRIRTHALRKEARELRTALRTHDIAALAAFPLFGETGVVGCLVVPLGEQSPGREPGAEAWRVACRAMEGLQLTAATAALRAALLEDRRRPGELFDGVLVVDRWERVVFSDGLFLDFPGWNREDPFGRALNGLPGGAILSAVRLSATGSLTWEEHLLPPIENHGIPVAVAALPFGAADGVSDGGRVVFLRDLRTDGRPAGDGTGRLLALGMRLAHAADELSVALRGVGGRKGHALLEHALLERFRAEAEEADTLVRKVLDRVTLEGHRDQVDLNDVVKDVLARYRPDLEAERVRVFSFLRPELASVPADRLELMRAMRLLVQEARESLRHRGGSLTVRTWAEEGWVFAAVSDDGAGPDGEAIERLFEPLFEPLDEHTDGASLDRVRAIAQACGGRLNVESRPGVWNRCTLMLPVERRRTPRKGLSPEVQVHASEEKGLEVLVVDDNAALRSVLKRYLERRGHRVTEAVDGDDALRMVEGRTFDRVVVDIRMPGKDGPEFFRCLEGVAPVMRERTIFMTGGFLEEGTERFIVESGRPAIKKPFDLTEMARTVEG